MSDSGPQDTRTIIVPESDHEEPVEALVRSEDIESTSRSCLAIIVILLLIAVMICAFLAVQPFLD